MVHFSGPPALVRQLSYRIIIPSTEAIGATIASTRSSNFARTLPFLLAVMETPIRKEYAISATVDFYSKIKPGPVLEPIRITSVVSTKSNNPYLPRALCYAVYLRVVIGYRQATRNHRPVVQDGGIGHDHVDFLMTKRFLNQDYFALRQSPLSIGNAGLHDLTILAESAALNCPFFPN